RRSRDGPASPQEHVDRRSAGRSAPRRGRRCRGPGAGRHRGRPGGGRVMLALATVTPAYYLILGSLIFGIGAFGLRLRRNPLVMLSCFELMPNAVPLVFVTFSAMLDDIHGQTGVVFVLVVAAAGVVVGLGIIVALLRKQPEATADDLTVLKG